MKYAIITGASKGLGASIAFQMINKGIGVFSVSRSENTQLKNLADEQQVFYSHYGCDLSDIKSVETTFLEIVSQVNSLSPDELLVFNNAGVVEPIETIGKLDSQSISTNIHINLLAPISITNLLLQQIADTKVTVTNVTSGAAEHPIHGWSIYCSTKAAVNMFTKTAALEQAATNNIVIGFSPGIMDTDMQQTIRSSSKEAFQDIETFRNYKEEGLLRSTDDVAIALVDLLLSNTVKSGTIYSVNQLLS